LETPQTAVKPAPLGRDQIVSATSSAVPAQVSKSAAQRGNKSRAKVGIAIEHMDIIKDNFWEVRPWILAGRTGKLKQSA
jgi:hypothetical protein